MDLKGFFLFLYNSFDYFSSNTYIQSDQRLICRADIHTNIVDNLPFTHTYIHTYIHTYHIEECHHLPMKIESSTPSIALIGSFNFIKTANLDEIYPLLKPPSCSPLFSIMNVIRFSTNVSQVGIITKKTILTLICKQEHLTNGIHLI